MAIKVNNKGIKSSQYTYSVILFSDTDTNEDRIPRIIWYSIKGLLNLFFTSKLGNFVSGIIYQAIFKNNGIVSYWLKYHCPTIIIDNLPCTKIESIVANCEEENIPVYKDIDPNTKVVQAAYIGPYWTNKLYYASRIDAWRKKIEETLNIKTIDYGKQE